MKVTIKGPIYPEDNKFHQSDSFGAPRRPKSLPLTSIHSTQTTLSKAITMSKSVDQSEGESIEIEKKEEEEEEDETNGSPLQSNSKNLCKQSTELSRRYSVPSNFDIQISPITNNTVLMSLPGYWNLDDDLFVNIIHRSFQFDVPLKGLSISIEEIMAESKYCLFMIFVQSYVSINHFQHHAIKHVK